MAGPLPNPDMHVNWLDFARSLMQWLSQRQSEPPIMPSRTQAQLKGIRTNRGAVVICTDLTTPEPVWFDGTQWLRFSDGTPI